MAKQKGRKPTVKNDTQKDQQDPSDASPTRDTLKSPPPAKAEEESTYFYLLIGAHVIAATLAPIQDCDEVFNFYEPSHYLNHGYGLQTWELSPEYAIRSWFYALIHAAGIYLGSWLPFQGSKLAEFYLCRGLLAAACATCEGRLYKAIEKNINAQVAGVFLGISLTSAGMFHASISYLPSSFAMYAIMLAIATIMEGGSESKIAKALTYFSIATIVGWPFVAVLSFPFILEELVSSYNAGNLSRSIRRLSVGVGRSLLVLGIVTAADSYFYKKLASVPLNIVLYNIFSPSGRGPDIYGTEPWHFYLRNLLINYNLWFILALLAAPLAIFQYQNNSIHVPQMKLHRLLTLTSPLYIWLAIFTLQPHKEERFMYPIYPCIALNAALSVYAIHSFFSKFDRSIIVRGVPTSVNTMLLGYIMLLAHFLGIWRSAGLSTAFRAPLRMYEPLHKAIPEASPQNPGITNVCIGKEWYRFPSSYHLPNNARLKFVQSDFDGLLPGSFAEDVVLTTKDIESGAKGNRYPGTWTIPTGMNDENLADAGKYTSIEECHYLVDTYFPSHTPTSLEPNYINDTDTWERVHCLPFLDSAATPLLGRLFWVPEHELLPIPARFKRQWGDYCLLKRVSKD